MYTPGACGPEAEGVRVTLFMRLEMKLGLPTFERQPRSSTPRMVRSRITVRPARLRSAVGNVPLREPSEASLVMDYFRWRVFRRHLRYFDGSQTDRSNAVGRPCSIVSKRRVRKVMRTRTDTKLHATEGSSCPASGRGAGAHEFEPEGQYCYYVGRWLRRPYHSYARFWFERRDPALRHESCGLDHVRVTLSVACASRRQCCWHFSRRSPRTPFRRSHGTSASFACRWPMPTSLGDERQKTSREATARRGKGF